MQGAGAGAGAGAAVVLCVAQVFGRGCHDGSITACMGAGAGADADAGASASAPPKKPTWKPRTAKSLRRAREHAAAKKLQQQRGLLRGRARAPRHAPPQEPTKAAKVAGKRSAAKVRRVHGVRESHGMPKTGWVGLSCGYMPQQMFPRHSAANREIKYHGPIAMVQQYKISQIDSNEQYRHQSMYQKR